MRAMILLLLVVAVQKSSCGSIDRDTFIKEFFLYPPDGSSTNSDNGGSNNGNNGSSCKINNVYAGTCKLQGYCDTINERNFSVINYSSKKEDDKECAAQHICCPLKPSAATTDPITVQVRQPGNGDLCRTVKGSTGTCRRKMACFTQSLFIDQSINERICDSPHLVCCLDQGEQTSPPKRFLTNQEGYRNPRVVNRNSTLRPVASRKSSSNVGFNCVEARKEDEGVQCGFRQSISLYMPGSWDRPIEEYEFPWMVSIVKLQSTGISPNLKYLCGGSLIHYQVVLTAAHCVDGEDNLRVRVGAWDLSQNTEHLQEAEPSRVIIHGNYNSVTRIYDVALVMLQKRFKKSSYIGLICLPTPDITVDAESCLVTGWGNLQEKTSSHPLRMVMQPLVRRDTCRSRLVPATKPQFKLHESFLCGGGAPHENLYKGDGGSPLVCTNGLRFYQRGIVSWGVEGEHGFPEVYADVSKVVPWISEQLRANHIKC